MIDMENPFREVRRQKQESRSKNQEPRSRNKHPLPCLRNGESADRPPHMRRSITAIAPLTSFASGLLASACPVSPRKRRYKAPVVPAQGCVRRRPRLPPRYRGSSDPALPETPSRLGQLFQERRSES